MASQSTIPVSVLLADDDIDDQHFFGKALKSLPFPVDLFIVNNGEKLLAHLSNPISKLPDVLFLDINMPRKNGTECLIEIKQDIKLRHLPVIMYSTSISEENADLLYKRGAHNYILKQELPELRQTLHHAISLILKNKYAQPTRDNFILAVA
jgi:CheY-like chemotaxis protein